MKINRILLKKVKNAIEPGKVIILYGPRRVGKTTLLAELTSKMPLNKYIQVDGDQIKYREVLSSQDSNKLKEIINGKELLIIDEAQRVENIGLNLKIMVDNFPQVAILVTGSASLDLASKISEPLTGRKKTFMLYPISYAEIAAWQGQLEARNQLERWLIFGTYPDVLFFDDQKKRENYLAELISGYLYKDVLDFGGVKKSGKIINLLRLLAFQIGQEVAVSELGANLSLDRVTVEKYLDLLEQSFVIFKVYGFSRNLRKEIAKTSRYYFYDNGVRNALIENFNRLNLRNDIGQLWENFLAVERRKFHQYAGIRVNSYFWRTYDKKEIDLIEEGGGEINGYEFKWQGKMKKSVKDEFTSAYPGSRVELVTKSNFDQFLM